MDRIRTLIIDDEPLARQGLRAVLQKDPEIEIVDEAGDGLEALEKIRSIQPDLIFLDIQMPELNGFEVLDSLGGGRATAGGVRDGVRSVCPECVPGACAGLPAEAV